MKTTLLNPKMVIELYGPKEEPTICISRMNITFNREATKQLALKEGVAFNFELTEEGKECKLHYKDVASDGFKITTLNSKGNAQVINKPTADALHKCLSNYFKTAGKSFKFQIGEFQEGKRQLLQIQK